MQRLLILSLAVSMLSAADLSLDLRTRVELFKGSGDWQEVHSQKAFAANQTAIALEKREQCYRRLGLLVKAEQDRKMREELARAAK